MPDFIDLEKGSQQAKDAAKTGRSAIEKKLLEGVEKALLLIEADAKRNCPADDGRLRSSITHSVEANEEKVVGRVGTNVEYAPYVHEGTGIYARNGNGRKKPWVYTDPKTGERVFTHGSKPRPFLREAMDQNQGRIAGIFKEAVDGL
jgi:HK97 gp10 family phage protein